jgi:hypothetical protein
MYLQNSPGRGQGAPRTRALALAALESLQEVAAALECLVAEPCPWDSAAPLARVGRLAARMAARLAVESDSLQVARLAARCNRAPP